MGLNFDKCINKFKSKEDLPEKQAQPLKTHLSKKNAEDNSISEKKFAIYLCGGKLIAG